MSLKLALLLAGVIIVISVAIGAMDRARVSRRRKRRSAEHPPRVGSVLDENADGSFAETLDTLVQEGRSASATLEKRKLQSDSPAPVMSPPGPGNALLDEIERYEQVADLRLDVDPEIDYRGSEARVADTARSTGPSVANERIDFIITLPGNKPVSRNRALGLFKQNEYVLDKPRQLYGLRHVTKVWSNLETDRENTEYDDLSLALQMVDQDGAVGESELNTFVQIGLTFGDQLRRRTLFSLDFEEALAMAQDLNEFCQQHDVIASINVVANSPAGFPGQSIEAALTDAGMQFGEMKIFHRYDDAGELVFSLANLYQPGNFDPAALDAFHTKGVTFFMQVPCVRDCVAGFADMIGVAMQFADRLGGRLVDQDMKSLTESGINTIRAQIALIAGDMRARGIPSGSEAALRLFGT